MHELGQTLFGLHQTFDPDKVKESSSNHHHHHSSSDNSSTFTNSQPSLKAISSIFASLSAIHRVKYDDNTSKVTQSIHDIEHSITSARLALSRRKEKQITYNTYLQQIKNRQTTLEKVQHTASVNPQPNSEQKVGDARKSLENARQSLKLALDDLIQCNERVFREFDRFKWNLDGELRRLYVRHARVQVDYSEQLNGEYGKLLGGGGESGGRGMGGVGAVGNGDGDADVMMI